VFFIKFRQLRLLVVTLAIIFSVLYLFQAKWFWRIFYPWPYRTEITQEAKRLEIDPYLLVALVRVESRFNTNAQSAVGARGLMQVMPETASWAAQQIGLQNFHENQLYQPEINLQIGTWYLNHLFEEFKGNKITGLAAYNAGYGNVHAWVGTGQWSGTMADLQRIPFPETQLYLRAVMRDYEIYKYLYQDENQ